MSGKTLNISLTPEQQAWVRGRKERGAYPSLSAVIQDLVRQQQEAEARALREEFERLQRQGAPGAEPVESVVGLCRKVKRERAA
jgi:Arc/MetJ-type ribon-helix-helix transcriptional regulator